MSFLDERFVPWGDQWAFLASVVKVGRAHVENVVQEAERRGRILGVRLPPQEDGEDEPWATPPSRQTREPPISGDLPSTLELVLGNQIYIAKEGLHPALRNRLLRLAAFQNPEFYKAQAMRLSTYDKPRVIACAEDHPHHISLPRGCLDETLETLERLGVRSTVRDERYAGRPLDVVFQGELRPDQRRAAEAMLAHETGVLAATTAFGKTIVGAWLIAKRGVSTLVLVHRRQLLDQWVDRLSTFLGVPAKSIGRIGGGRNTPTGLLDVAVIQSLVRKGVVDDRVADYGHLIVDECHHLSAHSFELAARQAKARFVLGLSATVARKDGHHPIVFMQCGPVRHRVHARVQAASRPFEHFALVQPTAFQPARAPEADKRVEFQTLYQELVADDARNRQICDDVLESVNAGRSPLVLTERNDHLDRLERELSTNIRHLVVLRAGMGKKQRQAVSDRLAAIPRDEAQGHSGDRQVRRRRFRRSTVGYAVPHAPGLLARHDCAVRRPAAPAVRRKTRGPRSTTMRTSTSRCWPVCSIAAVAAMRPWATRSCCRPARFPAGLPTSCCLSDPVWKRDYSGSVRRLVRDGVDTPLASLFVHAARAFPPDADGVGRARSATEAFVFRRLETLPETKGRFRLNVALPIPFDGQSRLEVDLLCADARVAIELDGAQHLADPVAYRRDRRKDQLLQENDYVILRFLAEDVGKELDLVLDTILRTLSLRGPSASARLVSILRRPS